MLTPQNTQTVLNSVQNYYIDSFSRYAASAIAAGTVFRSIIGGVIPLFAPSVFKSLGYGTSFLVPNSLFCVDFESQDVSWRWPLLRQVP